MQKRNIDQAKMTNSNKTDSEPEEPQIPRALEADWISNENHEEIRPFLEGSCSRSASSATSMQNNLSDPTRNTKQNKTNENTKQPRKRTVETIIYNEPISTSTSNDVSVDTPKKPKITDVKNYPGPYSKTTSNAPHNEMNQIKSIAANNTGSLKRKMDATDRIDTISSPSSRNNNDEVPTSKMSKYKNSSADSNELAKTSTKCGSQKEIFETSGSIKSTNRFNVHEKFILKDKKPSMKDKKSSHESTIGSDNRRYLKKLNDPLKEFLFLLHIITSKPKANQKFTGHSTRIDAMNTPTVFYQFTEEKDREKHLAFKEIKYFDDTSFISYKELFSDEFHLENYFKLFLHYNEKLLDNEIIEEIQIICNRELNHGTMQKHNVRLIEIEEKKRERTDRIYRFQISKEHKIYKKFSKFSILRNLAKKIVECIRTKNLITKKCKLLKEYFNALMNEDILVTSKINGNQNLIAKFHDKFVLNDNGLSDTAKTLRKHIIEELEREVTDRMSFKIYKSFLDFEKNPILTLPNEKFDDLFDAFFKAFRFEFIAGDIDSIIKESLPTNFTKITNDLDFKKLNDFILAFLERSNHSESDLLQSLNNEISRHKIEKKLLESIEPKVKVNFEQELLIALEQNVIHMNLFQSLTFYVTNHKLLSTLKFKQFNTSKITDITNDVEGNLFISANTLITSTDDVVRALVHSQFLTIRWDENCDKNQAQAALKKLERSIPDGKYVIIVINRNILKQLDPESKEMTLEEDQIFGLTSESQRDVLNFENIYLHGQSVRIIDIADDEAAADLIKHPQILEDILYRNLMIGKDFKKPDGFEEKFFDIQFLQYTDKNKSTEDVLNDESRITVISGRSGMGKSVYLCELAERLRASSNLLWIMQVNLNEELLKQFSSDESCNYETFFRVAVGLDEACQKLFGMALNGKLKIKVVLLFDGYDELRQSRFKSFVQRLLKELQSSNIYKIYVSSNSKALETALGVCPYSLTFCTAEKKQYLQKHPDINPANILENNAYRQFTNTPLHLKMLVDLMKAHRDLQSLKKNYDLYREYVRFKLSNNEFESACRISIKKILKKEEIASLNADLNTQFEIPKELLHETFTEFFAAYWLSDKSNDGQEAKYKVFQCIDRLVEHTSQTFIDTYLAEFARISSESSKSDPKTQLGSLVEELAQKGNLNFLKSVLNSKRSKKPYLRIAIESTHPNAREVLKCILEHYNDTDDTEIINRHGELKHEKYKNSRIVQYVNRSVNGESPLEMAARVQRIDLACELMLKGADISKLDKDFIDKVADYVVDNIIKGNERYQPITEKLLMLSSGAVQKLKNDNQYPKRLLYCFTHGQIQLIKMLLKDDPNRCTLLNIKVEDKFLLDHVNESEELNDSERCETVKYILDNIGDELRTRDKFYIHPILAAACKYRHTKTVAYFIDQYPGGCIAYINQAMRMNEYQTIKFVMSNKNRTVDKEGNAALHQAIISGFSPKTIGFLVKMGGIDDQNKAGETALCLSFKHGADIHLIKYLIKCKASLSVEDSAGLYPWCYAILENSHYSKEQQIELMRYLLKKGINAPGKNGMSWNSDRMREEIAQKLEYFQNSNSYDSQSLSKKLHEALKEPSKNNWCSFLIIHGADVNHQNDYGETPLHVALKYKRYQTAKMMLQFGAMFDVEDKRHVKPLQLMLEDSTNTEEATEMIELLKWANELFSANYNWDEFMSEKSTSKFWNDIETSPLRYLINCRNSEGFTLFHVAALANSEELAIELNEFSKRCCQKYKSIPALDVNVGGIDNETPLEVAVTRKSSDVIRQFLKIGAIYDTRNITIPDAKRLFKAAKKDKIETINKMLQNEYCNARDEHGKCVLHWANSHRMMQLLIRQGSELVHATDKKRRTPLHLAVKNDQLNCAILLLKHGAFYDAKDERYSTPFGRKPYDNNSIRLLKMIDKLFEDLQSDNPRILVCEHPDVLINYLSAAELEYGISPDVTINVRDSKNNTLLHYARKYHYQSVEENLIKHGAKLDVPEGGQVNSTIN